jgi:hypothetical protein
MPTGCGILGRFQTVLKRKDAHADRMFFDGLRSRVASLRVTCLC